MAGRSHRTTACRDSASTAIIPGREIIFTEADHSFFFGPGTRSGGAGPDDPAGNGHGVFSSENRDWGELDFASGRFAASANSEFVPIYIRLNHAEEAPALENQVEIRIEEVCAEEGIEAPAPVRAESLWEYFHRRNATGGTRATGSSNDSDFGPVRGGCSRWVIQSDSLGPDRFVPDRPGGSDREPAAGALLSGSTEIGPWRGNTTLTLGFRVVRRSEYFLAASKGCASGCADHFNRFRLKPLKGEQAMEVI